MNELEKMPLNTEETTTPATEQPAAAEVNATENVAAQQPAEAPADEAVAMEIVETEDPARFHRMTKEELLEELRTILAEEKMEMHREVASIKQAFHAIRTREIEDEVNNYLDQGNDPSTFASVPDEAENEFKQLYADFKEKRTQYLEECENRKIQNLEKKKDVIERIKSIIEDIDNINLHFPKFQELQAEFKSIKDIPASAETSIWKEYQLLVETFYDRLKVNKELRDLDFKKNLEAKRQLIDKAVELGNERDVVGAGRRLQELHDKWREIGPVAKDFRESIWEEFRAASTIVRKRYQDFFENRKAIEAANEASKTALCEEIEAIDYSGLKNFAQWDEATKKILDLQARWKEIGFAPRKTNPVLFARFRKSCDDFFTAKAEYYKQTKETLAANLAKKVALCERAEALKDMEDQRKAIDEVQKLREEWKQAGNVSRRHSDAIWKRFCDACNVIFEERKRKQTERRKEENANLAAKREIIEKLKAINPEETDRKEGIDAVRALQAEWQEVGFVPFKMKDKIYEEYRAECDRLYQGFDFSGARRRMSNFQNRMNEMSGDDNKLSRERERLYRAYEQKRAELKTYENNLGFFSIKSSSGNSMLKEMDRRIEKIKEELNDLKHKIEMIDEKIN